MPLPTTGLHTTVVLSIDIGGATGSPLPGGEDLRVFVTNFTVDPEQEVITTHYLGTDIPDEDISPRGFSGSMSIVLKDPRVLNAFDAYRAAKRAGGIPFAFMITQTTSFRGTSDPNRVVIYRGVELNISESYAPNQNNTLSIPWRATERI